MKKDMGKELFYAFKAKLWIFWFQISQQSYFEQGKDEERVLSNQLQDVVGAAVWETLQAELVGMLNNIQEHISFI